MSIVHGDYRLDNVRVNNSRVKAVVDWELCTLGDPLADLGTIIASWSNNEETILLLYTHLLLLVVSKIETKFWNIIAYLT